MSRNRMGSVRSRHSLHCCASRHRDRRTNARIVDGPHDDKIVADFLALYRLRRRGRTLVSRMIYGVDLAYVHHAGFSDYARRTGPEIVRLLAAQQPLSEMVRRRSRVIEFGSGGGTTARYLSGRGFDGL